MKSKAPLERESAKLTPLPYCMLRLGVFFKYPLGDGFFVCHVGWFCGRGGECQGGDPNGGRVPRPHPREALLLWLKGAEPVPRGWMVRHHKSIFFSYFSSLLPCVVPQIFHMLIFESQQLLDVSKKMKSNSQIVLYLVTKVVSI
jgi:hypothetical protein